MSASHAGPVSFRKAKPEAGLAVAAKKGGADIVALISDSGLKGRGGAGFPTGFKWKLTAEAQCANKYIVCNADEGEPGTFKDREILSECADLVFEGMTIAGRAVGTGRGILYLRGEYSCLRPQLEEVQATTRTQD